MVSVSGTTRVAAAARRQCVVGRHHFCFGLIATARTPDGVSPKNTRLKWEISPKPTASEYR
jgi:hypothetical protein